MNERYENDYENTANQWEETNEDGRVTYRERRTRPFDDTQEEQTTPRRRAQRDGAQPEGRRRTYEPTRTREYRADSRPGRTRESRGVGARAASAAGGAAEGVAAYAQPILLALIALLAVISIFTGIVSCATSGGEQSGEVNVNAATTTAAANVEAAEKTTDANGIISGTTKDGVNFRIVQAGQPTAATSESSSTAEGESSTAAGAESSTAAGAESSTAAGAESSSTTEGESSAAADAADGSASATAKEKVTFAAVGDQIASDYALELADGYAGQAGDGKYDFKPFYQEVKSFLQQSDLRYINQETPLIGGQENYAVSGYPNFISPEACAEAIADTGFNLVGFDSNHSYDAGTEGIEYSQTVWAKYPQIVVGGSYPSAQERETVHMIESNGIRFAFLAYSYGDNAYDDVSKEPNNYYAVPFVKDDAAADIARAKQVADCIIVSMHWGDEYSAELNADQKDWAQWLADQDVDLVVGTHAHNIQPVQYFTGTSGNKTPVVFGLGDFVSGWTITDTILSGIFTCDFVRQDTGRVSVENPVWHPTIEWSDGTGQTYVRMLENMTVDQINANTRTEDIANSFSHIYETTNTIITQIPVEWGSDAADKTARAASGSTSESSSATSNASGHVDEDEDGYDDNTDEWIGFGDEDENENATSDGESTTGPVDEDNDGYDDNTDEWIGFGDEDEGEGGDAGYVDEDGDGYDDNTDEWIGGDEDSEDEEEE